MNKERELSYSSGLGRRALIAPQGALQRVGPASWRTRVEHRHHDVGARVPRGGRPALPAGVGRTRREGTHDLLELLRRRRARRRCRSSAASDDMAIMTYTSDTTGPPRGDEHARQRRVQLRGYRAWCAWTRTTCALRWRRCSISPGSSGTTVVGALRHARGALLPVRPGRGAELIQRWSDVHGGLDHGLHRAVHHRAVTPDN